MPKTSQHRPFLPRALASGLAAVYLLTNVAASHATESAFWGERRRVARARFQPTVGETPDRPLYTQLPKNVSAVSDLSAVLEHAAPQTAVNFADLGKAVAQTTDRRVLDVAQAILPYGNIRFVRESKTPGAPLILHIQDVHGNLEAQKNMAEMMLALARDHGVQLAGLEGATGAFATDEFKPYPDQEAVKKVAAYFMKKDILGGPEYAALASEKPFTLWGIEDPALYQANVVAVKESLAGRTEAETFLASLTGALDPLKKTHYTEDLKSFDKNQTLYDQGLRGLGEYLQALTKFDGQKDAVFSLKFPNVSRLLSALQEEKDLNFAVVERDRQALVEKLVEKLTHADLEDLVRRSVDLRGGKTSHNAYHASLRALCARNGLSLSAYPSLTAYMHYVAASEDIDREGLIKEMGSLEASAQDALVKTAEQRKLVDLSRDTSRLKKLLANEMTPDEWAAYKARQSEIANLPVRVKEMDPNATVRWPESMTQFLSPFESFCARAMDRNAALTGRLLEKMDQEKQPIAVLVAGGFHTDGLMDTLAKQGASVAVLTPKIGQVDPNHRYLDAFAQDPLPLEKVFNGEPISMKMECPMGRESVIGAEVRKHAHEGIVAMSLERVRVHLTSLGVSLPDIKQELSKLLKEIKTKVPALGLFPSSLTAVTPGGVAVEFNAEGKQHVVTANNESILVSPMKAALLDSVWKSPTLREEWRIAWQEKFDFLSPIYFFGKHTQWRGIQNVIGGILILSLWVIMGETAVTVVDFLSNADLPIVRQAPQAQWVIGFVTGWFATLISHVGWNRLAETINHILAKRDIAFRLPRLTKENPTQAGGQVIIGFEQFSPDEKQILDYLDGIFDAYTISNRLFADFPPSLRLERDMSTLRMLYRFVEIQFNDSKQNTAIRAIRKEIERNLDNSQLPKFDFLVNTLALLSTRVEDVDFLKELRRRIDNTEMKEAITTAIQYMNDTNTLHRALLTVRQPSLFSKLSDVKDQETLPPVPPFLNLQIWGFSLRKRVEPYIRDEGIPYTETSYESNEPINSHLVHKELNDRLIREAIFLGILKHLGCNIPKVDLIRRQGKLILRRYNSWETYRDFDDLEAYKGLLGFLAVVSLSKVSFFDSKKITDATPPRSLISFHFSDPLKVRGNEKISETFLRLLKGKRSLFRGIELDVDVPFFLHRDKEERVQLLKTRMLAYEMFDIPDTVIKKIVDDVYFQVFGNFSNSGTRLTEKESILAAWGEIRGAIQRYYVVHPKERRAPDQTLSAKIVKLNERRGKPVATSTMLVRTLKGFFPSVGIDSIIRVWAPIVETILVSLVTVGWYLLVGQFGLDVWLNGVFSIAGWSIINLRFAALHKSFYIQNSKRNWVLISPETPNEVEVFNPDGNSMKVAKSEWEKDGAVYEEAIQSGSLKIQSAAMGIHSPLLFMAFFDPFSLAQFALATVSVGLHSVYNNRIAPRFKLPALSLFNRTLKGPPLQVPIQVVPSAGAIETELLKLFETDPNSYFTFSLSKPNAFPNWTPAFLSQLILANPQSSNKELAEILYRALAGKWSDVKNGWKQESFNQAKRIIYKDRAENIASAIPNKHRDIEDSLYILVDAHPDWDQDKLIDFYNKSKGQSENATQFRERVLNEKIDVVTTLFKLSSIQLGISMDTVIVLARQFSEFPNFTLLVKYLCEASYPSGIEDRVEHVSVTEVVGKLIMIAARGTRQNLGEISAKHNVWTVALAEEKQRMDSLTLPVGGLGRAEVPVQQQQSAPKASRPVPNLQEAETMARNSFMTLAEKVNDPNYAYTKMEVFLEIPKEREFTEKLRDFSPAEKSLILAAVTTQLFGEIKGNNESPLFQIRTRIVNLSNVQLRRLVSDFLNIPVSPGRTNLSQFKVSGSLGVWDYFSFTKAWSLSQSGWAEGWGTGMLYLVWLAGAMAFGFIPLAPPGLDVGSLLAYTLASLINPSLAFGAALLVLSITLHRLSGVKLRISESPVKDWPTVFVASFKSLSGLTGVPLIGFGVSLAAMGGVFGVPWMILGVAAGAFVVRYGIKSGAEAHRQVNMRVEANNLARDAVRQELDDNLRETLLGGQPEPMWFDSQSKNKVTKLIEQIKAGSMEGAIKQLSLIGRVKEVFVMLAGQMRNGDSVFVKTVFERAGKNWAHQSNGPLNLGAHDFKEWTQNSHLTDFFNAAIQAAIRSNRPVTIAAQESDWQEILTHLGVEAKQVAFTSVGIEGSILNARAFMAGKAGPLLVADMKNVINFNGIDVMSFAVFSAAITEQLRFMALVLQNA